MINIVGLGPGNISYTLPIAIETVKNSSIVIGASRNLENVAQYCKKTIDISIGLTKVAEYLKDNKNSNISVVVSGDTGFYSLLQFVKRHVDTEYINVIPGISSLQYLYSKLGRGYENCKLISLHGREHNFKTYITQKIELGILTDKDHNNQFIAKTIKELEMEGIDIEGIKIIVGERLSYPNEKITTLNIDESINYNAEDLSVVVIIYE